MTNTIQKPEWNEESGIYRFSWDSLNIYAEVSRLSVKDKALLGELKLYRKNAQGTQLIEQTQLPLLSDKSRNTLANSLFNRNKNVDWLSVLKYVCVITVDNYRKGEPLGYLGNMPISMTTAFSLYPLLKINEPTTIFADGGTGKSYLADYIAILIYYNIAGFYIKCIDSSLIPLYVNVLYLDWEASLEDHQRRVWAIKKGLGIEDDERTFYYLKCSQPLIDMASEIKKIIIEKQIGMIIVDSQVAASEGDSDKADGARKYYNTLRSFNCTSLTLDHVPKGNGLFEAKKPYGSTFKWNLSRSQFELKKYQQPGENIVQLALYHRKNNEGMLLKPFGYQIEFVNDESGDLDKIFFTGIDIPEELASGETNNLVQRVKKIITTNPHGQMSLKNISLLLKLPEKNILMCLNDNRELFTQIGDNWAVNAIGYENYNGEM
ncbi:MAG: AAA family ATPase [Lutibacter sp.]|jgi:hypothetical protein